MQIMLLLHRQMRPGTASLAATSLVLRSMRRQATTMTTTRTMASSSSVSESADAEVVDVNAKTKTVSSDVDFVPLRSRLAEHYVASVAEDLLVLTYDHSRGPSIDAVHAHIRRSNGGTLQPPTRHRDLLDIYSTPLESLPTRPVHQPQVRSLLLHRAAQLNLFTPKRRWRRRLVNPIDYTTVRRRQMDEHQARIARLAEIRGGKGKVFVKDLEAVDDGREVPAEVETTTSSSPGLGDKGWDPRPGYGLPVLRKVVLKIWDENAVQNKNILLPAMLLLQSISGLRADPLFALRGDASKKIREGMPLGAIVEMTGDRAYEFLDKLIQTVLPRLREWEGVDPHVFDTESGAPVSSTDKPIHSPFASPTGTGITLRIPATAVGLFPDIEPHYENFPQMFDLSVTIHTSARDVRGAVLLLSAFQMPFLKGVGALPVVKEKAVDDDPYAKYRKRKEREDDMRGRKK